MYGERIKQKRTELGLTRKELAQRVMSTPETIQLWEAEKIQPTILDLIILAEEFGISIDWLAGIADYDEDEHECDECEDFLQCKLIPHMYNFINNNEESAYIHVQLAIRGDDEDCVVYSGSTTAILSVINMLLKSLATETRVDYYDLVSLMASVYAKSELGGFFDGG